MASALKNDGSPKRSPALTCVSVLCTYSRSNSVSIVNNNKIVVCKQLIGGACDPLESYLPKLPEITGDDKCPYIEHISSLNEAYSTEDQTIYSKWVADTRLYYNSLSMKERTAVKTYIGHDYRQINHCVECVYNQVSNNDKTLHQLIDTLHHVIKNAPRPSKILYAYRGSSPKWMQGVKSGKFVSKIFASFSMNPKTAMEFKIYSEVMEAKSKRRSMFGHSYESIKPE